MGVRQRKLVRDPLEAVVPVVVGVDDVVAGRRCCRQRQIREPDHHAVGPRNGDDLRDRQLCADRVGEHLPVADGHAGRHAVGDGGQDESRGALRLLVHALHLVAPEVDEQHRTEDDERDGNDEHDRLPGPSLPSAVVEILPVQVQGLARLVDPQLAAVELQLRRHVQQGQPVLVRRVRRHNVVLERLGLQHHEGAADAPLDVEHVALRAHLVVALLDLLLQLGDRGPEGLHLPGEAVVLGDPESGLLVRFHLPHVSDSDEVPDVTVVVSHEGHLVHGVRVCRGVPVRALPQDLLEVLLDLLLVYQVQLRGGFVSQAPRQPAHLDGEVRRGDVVFVVLQHLLGDPPVQEDHAEEQEDHAGDPVEHADDPRDVPEVGRRPLEEGPRQIAVDGAQRAPLARAQVRNREPAELRRGGALRGRVVIDAGSHQTHHHRGEVDEEEDAEEDAHGDQQVKVKLDADAVLAELQAAGLPDGPPLLRPHLHGLRAGALPHDDGHFLV
mmetsp:Transcript_57849/g.152264  ORF Transcript_57849/g.152264 Transcript_57849/m.152264 type:complete len:497 (+) Transcript_57849:1923-3413(+)